MKAYFISGLAADSRVFKHIELPAGFQIQHLHWITPLHNESLAAYAQRLSGQIDTSNPFALVGLSMGGMLASEIAKIHPPAVTILLSSVPVHTHLPRLFSIAYKLKLYKIVPIPVLKNLSVLKRHFFPDNPADKAILKQVIKDSDPRFIRWALQAILQWKNETPPGLYWHIHGSRDEILPIKYTRPTHIIKGGNHLMIMSRAAELNQMLYSILINHLPGNVPNHSQEKTN